MDLEHVTAVSSGEHCLIGGEVSSGQAMARPGDNFMAWGSRRSPSSLDGRATWPNFFMTSGKRTMRLNFGHLILGLVPALSLVEALASAGVLRSYDTVG